MSSAAGQGTQRLERRLSFADTTLEAMYTSMGTAASKDVLADFPSGYFEAILLGQTLSSFRELQSKTLSFWVKCYNKWLAMKEPHTLNFEQMQHVFGLRHHLAMSVTQVFDKKGFHELSIDHQSSKALGGIKVSACGVMLAGVWLSPVIAVQNKILFAFGLFDKDDSGSLSEREFRSFAQAISTSMALVFGTEPLPPSALHRLTEIYYRRISAHAGRRIRDAVIRARQGSESSVDSVRDAVKQQIRARQGSESQTQQAHTQQVPFSVLQDFVFGKASEEDPLTLPFRLLLERFNPNRSVTFVDEFTDGQDGFRLSHAAPVTVPEDPGSSVSVANLLTRAEVVFSREMYQEVFELKAEIAEADLVERMDESRFIKSVREGVASRLVLLNRDLCEQSVELRGEDGLFKMWKALCPAALPQHLKMFEKWCQEYDDLTDRKRRLKLAKSAATVFHENDLKPLLPAEDIRRIKDEFSRLDTYGKGIIEISKLGSVLQLGDLYEIDDMAKYYDVDGDGYVDADEFVRMMCPSEYRLPEMDGFGRQLFGELIEHEATGLDDQYNEQTASFEKGRGNCHHLAGATPHTLLPEVDKGTWATWNATFDRLDVSSTTKVSLSDLIGSGLLSPEVATFVHQVIKSEGGDGDGGDGFSREDFMSAMLRVHGVRRPHWLAKEACLGEDR